MPYRTKRAGKEDSVQVGASVPVSIKEEFRIKCEEIGATPSSILRQYIYQYLKNNNNNIPSDGGR